MHFLALQYPEWIENPPFLGGDEEGDVALKWVLKCVFTVWSLRWYGLFHTSGVAKCFNTSVQ